MTIRRHSVVAVVLASIMASMPTEADAQFRKLREKAQQMTEEVIDRTTDKVADKVVDKAADHAAGQINAAIDEAYKEEAGQAAASGNVGEGLGALSQSLNELGRAYGVNSNVEPVDFRELKALLPESLPGLSRGEATGQKGGAMGIKMSSAEATYTAGDRQVRVSIADMGTMTGATMFGYAWLAAEIDVENDRGYERTTKVGEFPGYEKFESYDGSTHGELTAVVGERFVVALSGDNVDMNLLKSGLSQIDVAKLASMKDVGVTPDPEADANQAEVQAALDDLSKAYAAPPAGGVEPVDFRVLKDLLPATAAGFARSEATGQKGSAFGIHMSSAEGLYEDGDRTLRVTVTDMGTLTDLARLSYAWLAAEVEQESDTGYERTFVHEGYPAFMSYHNADGYETAEIQVVVKDRFIVAVEGDAIDMDTAQKALASVNLGSLPGL